MRRQNIRLAIAIVYVFALAGCGELMPDKKRHSADLREAWNFDNSPSHMDSSFIAEQRYTANFAKLPLQAKLKRQPWSDDYWATNKGGISYRWNALTASRRDRIAYPILSQEQILDINLPMLSPAEKYDLFTGHSDFPLTLSERKRTNVLKIIRGHSEYQPGFFIASWQGLCHAWAPATFAYEEPDNVTLVVPTGLLAGKLMPFGASDVKALLTYFLHVVDGESQHIGMRCNFNLNELMRQLRNGTISEEAFQAAKAACDDTNAGAFHIVLANQIGRLEEGFIVDVTRELEVWNHPVYGYESKILSEQEGASEGSAPGTVKEIIVQTRIDYIVEVSPSWRRIIGAGKKDRSYTYRLEIDEKGDIIGGHWPEELSDRPDFLWKQKAPEFGEAFAPLKLIYQESAKGRLPVIPPAPVPRSARGPVSGPEVGVFE